MSIRLLTLMVLGFCSFAVATHAQLRGHGGPVRALAVSPDGRTAISGSFDSSVIRWSLVRDSALQVLRFHDGAVNAVATLKDGRIVTAGEDRRIAIWMVGATSPNIVLEGHDAPVSALAVSPDGMTLASAAWDRSVRLWQLVRGSARVLDGHQQNVNGVAFTPDGNSVVSVGYDLTVRIWPVAGGVPTIVTLPAPLNCTTVARDGEIIVGAADGKVYFLAPDGQRRGEIETGSTPIIAIAISPDGARVAAAAVRGSIAVIDRTTRRIERMLIGPGLPVWSAAFLPDSRTLLTGGTDRMIRRWNTETGDHIGGVAMAGSEDPLAKYAGDRGAEVFRACVACHTLAPDDDNRAGPTLVGLFGRRIATLSGYNFSQALKQLDIVWTPETVAKLFEIGPAAYTPGSKMPEQRIGSAEDRAALVRFLESATKKR